MKSLVLTSVNPFSRLDYQKLCFDAWNATGYSVRTVNCADEAKKLINAGFNSQDIDIIPDSETSLGLYGKAIPRIVPVINRAKDYNYDTTFLTNSDIYPIHQRPLSRFLSSIGDAIALTRNECVRIDDNQFIDSFPYRGGLDIFFFTRQGIEATYDLLKTRPTAERMTYGIPGWDFYLGYLLISQLNAKIIDGEVFLHQRHKTSYNQIDEFFELYAKEMKTTGFLHSNDSNTLAAEFADLISRHCENNTFISKILRTAFYVPLPTQVSPQAETVYARIKAEIALKKIDLRPNPKRFIKFIDSQIEDCNWSSVEYYQKSYMKMYPADTLYLLMLVTQLMIKQQLGCFHIATNYPENNAHGLALRQIINNTRDHEEERLTYIIRLFSSELIDYGIINPILFKYIVWSANNDYVLGLCNIVYELCMKGM
ncbi:MAG: hypothetical protein PHI97_12300 [Desulfobulbus sp.]|nr:hypothetical protein [Desulfobulbus sp.]